MIATHTTAGPRSPLASRFFPCPRRTGTVLAALLLFLAADLAAAQALDCSQATVVSSAQASPRSAEAVNMLIDEAALRTGARWASASRFPLRGTGCVVVAAAGAEMASLLPPELARAPLQAPPHAEAFSLRAFRWRSRPVVLIAGHDERGVLFGVGALLRKLSLSAAHATLPRPLLLRLSPEKPIRGHQLGYRAKSNTYDAWNLAQFEQQIRDLAIFGANTIQLIAPHSDDEEASPLFPAPALETLIGISRILDRYGLNCDLFYPEMEDDYSRPADVARELARFEDLVRQIPRLDTLWIPGGDPGHTSPTLLFPLIAREAEILRRSHPHARIYVSAQGMDKAQYDDFYRLAAQHPAWLSGVFFGPQSRDSFQTQRRRIPGNIPLVFYPDIGHTLHAQFPVDQWDPVFALTQGREPIDPRPMDEAVIYRRFAGLNIGFESYSEGVNDDLNKCLWSQWGWRAATPPSEILQDYARFFLGPAWTRPFAQSLFHLERNWRGPILENAQIPETLRALQRIEASAPANNWRLELALYRAYYDAFLQTRLRAETAQQQQAMEALRQAPALGVEAALRQAEAALTPPAATPGSELRQRVFTLAGNLFRHIGMQLSVPLYGALNWERGANLDRIDIPLNDRLWLTREFARIRALPAPQQAAALNLILDGDSPPPGAFYDDLGNSRREPHLVRGPGFRADPEFYRTAIDGVADQIPNELWRWSQLTYAEALYEAPLRLRYQGLDPSRRYRLRVVYAGEDFALPLRLTANRTLEIHPPLQRASNPQTLEFELPAQAARSGALELEWARPKGLGGGGRGRQIAQVWLFPLQQASR